MKRLLKLGAIVCGGITIGLFLTLVAILAAGVVWTFFI